MKAVSEREVDAAAVDRIIDKHRDSPGNLLGIMEEAQELNRHNFLPRQTLEYIAESLGLPFSKVYSVATFYAFFNLKPQGEHSIIVCRGTACHTKGSKALLEHLEGSLGIKGAFDEGESYFTTPDNKFTVRTVACFGQCALAPVVVVDDKIHVHMNESKLARIVKELSRGGKKK
ncbi:MAG: NAD(P)H-dependent oxidoreductase subunit E [Candidatus Omnitrophota bacterium]|jgi:NADH-quinone oxidoreductase subunit E